MSQSGQYPTRLPPAFCDNLSPIPLTRNTLDELNRISEHAARQIARTSTSPATKEVQIKRFARHGGPDTADIRGPGRGRRTRKSATLSKCSSASSSKPSTRSTGPYDWAFQQHLINHGIMERPRASLSPTHFTQEDFDAFMQADADASKEWQVMSAVIPIIEGEVEDGKCLSGQIPFSNLDCLTDNTLVAGNPDRYYGALLEQLNQQLQEKLNKRIIPSTQKDLPIAPNFFLAVKGPDGSLPVAARQACYDGALGARGMHSLQTYGKALEFDNNAYTLTSTYQSGNLRMYTSHLVPPANPTARPEYVMTQVGAYALNHNHNSFRTGASAYRNARDWAKQTRDEAIQAANEAFARNASAHAPDSADAPTASSIVSSDDASADERCRLSGIQIDIVVPVGHPS
ncbi:hypothetical protein F4861DRAFT_533893 [Xylaria intraflava]|nr:hypothetical protein F4861DRAFT_533893 [Xylaria intraflava]